MDKPPRPFVELAANCACGAVAMRVRGTVRAMLMCACEDCQKATGTGHSTGAMVARADLSVEGPTQSFARPADSGATFTRWFCPHCGTPLFGQSSRAAEMAIVSVGFFGARTEWYVPNQLIFSRSHRTWDRIAEELPRHETYRRKEG